jgi:hypothetical protein
LNDRSEIHGSCRHTARFHRLRIRSGTDDPSKGERVVFFSLKLSGQAAECGFNSDPVAGFYLALDVGPKK